MSEIKCQIHIDLTSSEPGLTLPDPNELLSFAFSHLNAVEEISLS